VPPSDIVMLHPLGTYPLGHKRQDIGYRTRLICKACEQASILKSNRGVASRPFKMMIRPTAMQWGQVLTF